MFSNLQVNINNFPKIEDIEFKAIHKNYLKVILLNILLFLLLIIVAFSTIYFTSNKIQEINLAYAITGIIILFSLITFYFYIGFSRRKYALREKDISYKSGVFTKTITTVPFNRIQHVEIDEGLFSRIFKLASINIFTAGAQGVDLSIKGISKEKANYIKEYITNIINE
ncbi:MAG TPA: PH domain-containing protein [Flavobacteriaceae bacterium]|nr:PH domain-containing protein [Flavobacteriaceae bacterium]HIP27331.1 PH domain-containing protein [Flavobacteriaceae bacterium]